VPQPPES
jgi:DNA-binding transcriptional LysR family regulator